MNNETKPSLSQDGIGSDAKTLFVGANPSKEFERNMEGVRGIIKGLSEVLTDGPAEGIDNTPWMDYQDAGKEAYAEERVIVFRAKPTGQKFAAHPEGHYIALTLPVEPTAPVQPKKYLEWAKAGGPNECSHGYAAGIPCPRCDEASQPAPVVVPGKSKLDDISLRSLRTLCMGKMERSGDYAQVSIFAKTILTLLDENAELLTAHPAPLPSDQKEYQRGFDAGVAAEFEATLDGIEAQELSPAALPVGQKETFEEWQRSPEACAIFAEYAPGFAAPMIKAAKAAWNAARGQKETK